MFVSNLLNLDINANEPCFKNNLINKFVENEAVNFINQIINSNCDAFSIKSNEYHFYFQIVNINKNTVVSPFVVNENEKFIFHSITSLSNTDFINIVTNINFEKYKFKKYRETEEKNIFASLNEDKKCIISFNNTFTVHLLNNINGNNNYVLHLWCVSKNENFEIKLSPHVNLNQIIKIDTENNINFDFFENILYKNIFDKCGFIKNIINDKIFDSNNFEIINTKFLENNKHNNIINNCNIKKNIEEIKLYTKTFNNRFVQRYRCQLIDNNFCNTIIEEANNYASLNKWNDDGFKNFKTYGIEFDKLENIHSHFVKEYISKIFNYIISAYSIPNFVNFDLTALNITKYSQDLKPGLEIHADGAFLTFIIALNHYTEYTGGETYFNDGTQTVLNKGEMLVHCGKIPHGANPVISGERYILIGFINLILNV